MQDNLKVFENSILNMDCLDFMKECPDNYFDLVLTDPPYGIGSKFQSKYGLQSVQNKKSSFDWNNAIPSEEIFLELIRISKNQIIFGANYFTKYVNVFYPTNSWIVWDKIGELNLKNPFSDCELAWTSFKKPLKKYTCINMGFICQKEEKSQRIHPTQKPLKLIERILNDFSTEDDLIFDAFSGSGTTAVACHNLRRRFICTEKNKDYFNSSIQRLKIIQAQQKLF